MNHKSTNFKPRLLMDVLNEPVNYQLELIQHSTAITQMLIHQLLSDSVYQQVGERYGHEEEGKKELVRHGYNPSSVRVGSHKIRVEVPRVRNQGSEQCVSLPIWKQIKRTEQPSEELLQSVLLGVSMRDYRKTVRDVMEGFGVSKSSVSNQFIKASAGAVKAFKSRSVKEHQIVALLIDGKYFMDDQMVIVMGITDKGEKVFLDFTQTNTENSRSIKQLLQRITYRGVKFHNGILVVIDGGKGIHKAVVDTFGTKAIIQRCTWHKRENVISHLKESEKEFYRKRLQNCYSEIDYEKANAGLEEIMQELEIKNPDAAASLQEGLEETLTLQKLGMAHYFAPSLGTTNCIENVNRLVQQRVGKIRRWVNGSQKQRWLAMSLLDIETRLNKIRNYKKLSLLQERIKVAIKKKSKKPLRNFKEGPRGSPLKEKISTKKRT